MVTNTSIAESQETGEWLPGLFWAIGTQGEGPLADLCPESVFSAVAHPVLKASHLSYQARCQAMGREGEASRGAR